MSFACGGCSLSRRLLMPLCILWIKTSHIFAPLHINLFQPLYLAFVRLRCGFIPIWILLYAFLILEHRIPNVRLDGCLRGMLPCQNFSFNSTTSRQWSFNILSQSATLRQWQQNQTPLRMLRACVPPLEFLFLIALSCLVGDWFLFPFPFVFYCMQALYCKPWSLDETQRKKSIFQTHVLSNQVKISFHTISRFVICLNICQRPKTNGNGSSILLENGDDLTSQPKKDIG